MEIGIESFFSRLDLMQGELLVQLSRALKFEEGALPKDIRDVVRQSMAPDIEALKEHFLDVLRSFGKAQTANGHFLQALAEETAHRVCLEGQLSRLRGCRDEPQPVDASFEEPAKPRKPRASKKKKPTQQELVPPPADWKPEASEVAAARVAPTGNPSFV